MSSKRAATAMVANDEDDEYHSSEDEDFNPDLQPTRNDEGDENSAESSYSESEEEDTKKHTRKPSKRKANDLPLLDRELVEENSGDEAIMRGAKAKRKKDGSGYDDEEEDEGPFIKTRSQKAKEVKKKVKRSTTTAADPTVDIDALWKSLNSPSPPKTLKPTTPLPGVKSTIQTVTTSKIEHTLPDSTSPGEPDESGIQVSTAEAATAVPLPAPLEGLPVGGVESRAETTAIIPAEENGMVAIKRTYEFAGETIIEEKQVAANSFEARAYLSSLQAGAPQTSGPNPPKPLRRPMRKISKFDPAFVGAGGAKKASKLNTLEKSRLDWAGFVDKEGIGDELDKKRREGGDSYLERQDFLGRVGSRTSEKR
ncbi:swr complex subunit [Orbilia oligospora]|uniref:SWR1-complex protein 5 n=1 Tax=Orbilia oligospora TaxID=2813651 RepID=A0A7C8JC49_ORBOL|nr:swr complex subunit [Orbilia oligospora]KAF3104660.1 swr complex subunit [Orbilia oligospora]KAF3115357.1 swr complex subunit [Orbilia oligospora]KAF3139684.1 swr complex subunit [Orbilia oligospora]